MDVRHNGAAGRINHETALERGVIAREERRGVRCGVGSDDVGEQCLACPDGLDGGHRPVATISVEFMDSIIQARSSRRLTRRAPPPIDAPLAGR